MSWSWVLCLFGRHDWVPRLILTGAGWVDDGSDQCRQCRQWAHGRRHGR